MSDFSNRLDYAMKRRDIGNNELERLAKLSRGYASKLRSGGVEMPSIPIVKRLAEALRCRFEWLAFDQEPWSVQDTKLPDDESGVKLTAVGGNRSAK